MTVVRYTKVETTETTDAPFIYVHNENEIEGGDCNDLNSITVGCNKYHRLALFKSLLMIALLGILVVAKYNQVVHISPLLLAEDNSDSSSSNNYLSSSTAASNQLNFVHIPKNAGTYVENLAAAQDPPVFFGSKREMRWPLTRLERPWKNSSTIIEPCNLEFRHETGKYVGWNKNCCSWWHIPPRMFSDFDSSTPLLAILRDPIERAISEVRWEESLQSQHKTAPPLTNETLSARIRDSLRKYLNNTSTITTEHDCHYLPQYLYVTDAQHDKLLPNMDILCFERLDSDLRERFPNFVFFDDNNNNSTTTIDRNESPKQQKHQAVLEQDVMDLLRDVYAWDFELHEQFCSD